MLNTVEEIFEKIIIEERSCLEKIHEYIKTPDDFGEAFDNMYFDNDEFEDLILRYADLIKFNRELYNQID